HFRRVLVEVLNLSFADPVCEFAWVLFLYIRTIPPVPRNISEEVELMLAVLWVVAHNWKFSLSAADARRRSGAGAPIEGDAPTPVARKQGAYLSVACVC